MTATANKEHSAIRNALEGLKPHRGPITQEQIDALGEVALWRLLLEPYIPQKRGIIERPPQVDDAERILSKVGRVVQIGCFCFQSKTAAGLDLSYTKPRPQVGDYWLFEMYAGQEVHLRSGHILRILTETELLMKINDPELIRGYAE